MLFISATSVHTDALVEKQILKTSNILGLNPTVLLHQKALNVSKESALHRILDPNLTLGISTTGLDPSADEFEILHKISSISGIDPQALQSRTRIITGGRETPNSPQGRNQYGWIMETQDVDLLLTFNPTRLKRLRTIHDSSSATFQRKSGSTDSMALAFLPTRTKSWFAFYHWLLSDVGQEYLRESGFEAITSSRSFG